MWTLQVFWSFDHLQLLQREDMMEGEQERDERVLEEEGVEQRERDEEEREG